MYTSGNTRVATLHGKMANFSRARVADLKTFLQVRGITCSDYEKDTLRDLAEAADRMGIEEIPVDDHEDSVNKRRRVERDGVSVDVSPVHRISTWTDNLSSLPEVEFGDVFVYLKTKCEWPDERLKRYKSDNGYQLHMCRHISRVQLHNTRKQGLVYVRGQCLPQTRQSEKPYDVWTLLGSTGCVELGGCTCVAADQGTCKHVIALLFSVQAFVERQLDRSLEVGTDVVCKWGQSRKTSKPMQTVNIDYRITHTHKKIEPLLGVYNPMGSVKLSDRDVEAAVYALCKEAAPTCLQVHILRPHENDTDQQPPRTDTDTDSSPPMPIPTLTDLASQFKGSTSVPLSSSLFEDFLSKNISNADKAAISYLSQGSEEWLNQRKWRVTASIAKTVTRFRLSNKEDNSLVKKVAGLCKFSSASVEYGHNNEANARHMYSQRQSLLHINFNVAVCGLFIHGNHPFLGASPDGLVTCDCCTKGLLEIKCTYKFQNLTPAEVAVQQSYHCFLDEDGTVKLKRDSAWFYQIQMQLGVTELKYCDFVLYTQKDISIERIYFDSDMWRDIMQKSITFYRKFIIPKLLD